MLKKGLVILFSGVLTVSLVGCNNSEDNGGKSKDSKDKLEVKTTVYP